MAETDIYKNRESTRRYTKRRRRSTSIDQPRKRRSRNSGFRRLLHLYRKEKNQRIIMWVLVVMMIALLVFAVVWDLVVKPQKLQDKESPFILSPINSVK
jgi:hypothetical protein